MKYLVASFILLFCTLQTFSQQDYFIYLQTDNSQAFYLRINNTVYSSTASGYLILSKLPDSTASVTIGFTKTVLPEQQFNIPLNRKDAGYLLKNFGDKGWGLFNLQTMGVIMNSNAAQEKKSPEINGSRKNDAFTLLLANAVNDTAVLYVASKPEKVLPPAPIAIVEKKKDIIDPLLPNPPQHDSIAIVIEKPVVIDSSITTKKTAKPVTDGISTTRVRPVINKDSTGSKKAAADSVALAKIKSAELTKKAITQPPKDSLVTGSSVKPVSPAIAAVTNKPARKDTIIMMSELPAVDRKQLEKEAKIAAARKKDSLQLAKKQGGKNNTAVKKQTAAGVSADTSKNDILISKSNTKKDTAALVKTELPAAVTEKKDAIPVDAPQKRTKPLLYKAADLLTDTSYVAVFVDESKEKFDTIRISIAFNDAEAAAKKEIVAAKEAAPREKTVAAKKVIDSINNPSVKLVDTVRETAEKEKLAATKTPPTAIAPVKTDNNSVNQEAKDSLPVTVKKDPAAKADSAKKVKSTAPALFLNSDCKETALDADIDKLRIKMLLVASDEEKIALAKKVFRQKCFLTTQVKALSELYKTDEGKYKWFDAVYAFVADSGNFSKLSELLKDDYYLNRFKAMLRN